MPNKLAIQTLLDKHQITILSEFVPFSQSRNKDNEDKSLNWMVTFVKGSKLIITTPYSAGIGHCPSYKWNDNKSIYRKEQIEFEIEHGLKANNNIGISSFKHALPKQPIKPNTLDVIYSLLLDADVLNSDSYEDWASNTGFDPDSRKGEKLYKQALEIALKLRNALGETVLNELTEAFREY